jgi:phage shock protein A
VQTAQTIVLVIVAGALIYALQLLRVELRRATQSLREVLTNQKEFERRFERVWVRIDTIEQAIEALKTARRDDRPPGP